MIKKIIINTLVLIILFSCATTSITMNVRKPSEINLKGYDTVVIYTIEDEEGKENTAISRSIRDEITASLFNSGKYDILDRDNLDKTLKEQELSLTGAFNNETTPELGEFLGAAVIVFGRISQNEYQEETKTKTYEHGDVYNTREGSYSLTVNLKLINIETSKILAVRTFQSEFRDKTNATNQDAPKIDKALLLDRCIKNISNQFMMQIAPHYEKVQANFQTDRKLPEIDQAIILFKIDEWEDGIELLEQSIKKGKILKPNVQAKAYYNLALAQQFSGNYKDAITNFKKAMMLNPKLKLYQNSVISAKAEMAKIDNY